MKMKKLLALMLCIVMLLLIVVACDSADVSDLDDNEAPNETPPGDIDDDNNDHSHGWIDYEAALSAFPPDTIMVKAGELTLTWAELFVFPHNTVRELESFYGAFIDWSEEFEAGITLADLVLEYSNDEALSFLSFEYGANAIGFQLSDEDIKSFNSDIEDMVTENGGREAFETFLRNESGFYNFDVFKKLYMTSFMIDKIVYELYGEDTTSFPDDKVAAYAKENGFLMAMHILRLKSDDEDDGTDPLGDAEDILKQLNEKVGSEDFIEFFKALMNEQSEDFGGLMSYPNGYLFLHGDMVSEFSDTTAALEIGELSGIVETMYGYHIILRIPIDYDVVPSGYSREGLSYTLRQIAAREDFNALIEGWHNALNPEYTPEFNSIDLAVLFKAQDEDCDH